MPFGTSLKRGAMLPCVVYWPGSSWYVPVGQAVHSWSEVDEPWLDTNSFSLQGVKSLHEAWLTASDLRPNISKNPTKV